jgi:hypothetical protein
MKQGITLLIVLVMLGGAAFSQSFTLQVSNQHADGTNFYFNVIMSRTGDTPLYLGNCDIALTFTSANFTSPVASVEAADDQLNTWYSIDPSVNGSAILLSIAPPPVANAAQVTARALNVSTGSSLIATVKITGISNPSGTMGLAWKSSGPSSTKVTAFDLGTLNQNDITGNGSLVAPGDQALPISLASFAGSVSGNESGVVLSWKTLTETNNYGFYVQRKADADANYTELAFVPSAASDGTTITPQQYKYTDKSLGAAGKYQYRLKQVDRSATFSFTEPITVNVTLADVAEVAPRKFQLLQNYPNPFNPSTQVKFSVENTTHATMKIYNMLGAEVATIFDGMAEAGRYYHATFDARNLASGVYIYRLVADKKVDVKRMLLIK